MKNTLKEIRLKTLIELKKDLIKQKANLAKMSIDFKVNLPKDTNIVSKTKKSIAQLLTVINEKKILNK